MGRPMRMAAVLLTATLAVSVCACSRAVDGQPVVGPREVDQAYFFAGDVPTYGQTVSEIDKTKLAYLRALRRVDVCGLAARDAVATIGDIASVGTLFAFNECDIEVKVSGVGGRMVASVELVMSRNPGQLVAFRVGEVPVYQSTTESCDYLIPLPLDRLPGATPLRKPDGPFVHVGLTGRKDCAVVQRMAAALAERLPAAKMPARDALAEYPAPLAERDPCEVLSVVGDDIDSWEIGGSQPYRCRFSIWHGGSNGPVHLSVRLQPQAIDAVAGRFELLEQDGVAVYLNPVSCLAISFVGPTMQRKEFGGSTIDGHGTGIRPAVVVDAIANDCEIAADVAMSAARLYS